MKKIYMLLVTCIMFIPIYGMENSYMTYFEDVISTEFTLLNTKTKRSYILSYKNNIFDHFTINKIPFIIALAKTVDRTRNDSIYNNFICIWDTREIDTQQSNFSYYVKDFLALIGSRWHHPPKVALQYKKEKPTIVDEIIKRKSSQIEKIIKAYKSCLLFKNIFNSEKPTYYTTKQNFKSQKAHYYT